MKFIILYLVLTFQLLANDYWEYKIIIKWHYTDIIEIHFKNKEDMFLFIEEWKDDVAVESMKAIVKEKKQKLNND